MGLLNKAKKLAATAKGKLNEGLEEGLDKVKELGEEATGKYSTLTTDYYTVTTLDGAQHTDCTFEDMAKLCAKHGITIEES